MSMRDKRLSLTLCKSRKKKECVHIWEKIYTGAGKKVTAWKQGKVDTLLSSQRKYFIVILTNVQYLLSVLGVFLLRLFLFHFICVFIFQDVNILEN